MPKWFAHSLQGRVLLTLLVLGLAPLTVAVIQGYHCAHQAVSDLAQKHLVSVVRAREALIGEWYTERIRDIHAIESTARFVEETKRAVSSESVDSIQFLQDVLSKSWLEESGFEDMSLYTPDWRVLARAEFGEHADTDLLTESLMTDLGSSDEVVLEKVHSHNHSTSGAHIGHAIHDDAGNRIAYLVGNLDVSKSLAPLLQERSGLWKTGKVYLANNELEIFTEPFSDKNPISFRSKASPDVLSCLSAQKPLVLAYLDYRGHEVLGTAVRLPAIDWILVVEIDRAEALEWLNILTIRALLTAIVTLATIWAASVWMASVLGRPLRNLVQITNRIRAGHTDERVPPTQIVEADEVGKAVNEMLDELRRQQDVVARASALAKVGEVTSSIVHEMRNPLSSVKMNLQALSRTLPRNDANAEAAQLASTHLTRIENMLTDLLQFGRPIIIETDKVSFEELAKMSVSVAADLIREKAIHCDIKRVVSSDGLVVDKEQMCRALSNLIVNAAHASPVGASVEVVLEPSTHGKGYLDIVVRDSGTGLTEMAKRKVFQPFFTTKPGGTGLGLANVRKIVELHGGYVSAANTAPCGAEFRISLPSYQDT